MIERIDSIEGRGRGRDRRGGRDTDALEELRVRYLGRKAELPNLLRGVAELPPEERGAVGKAANQARQALEALIDARAAPSSSAAELRRAAGRRPRRRDAARRRRRSRSAACTC